MEFWNSDRIDATGRWSNESLDEKTRVKCNFVRGVKHWMSQLLLKIPRIIGDCMSLYYPLGTSNKTTLLHKNIFT